MQAYGLMNLEFRPVDCTTKQPLIFLPGYINETIYSDQMESGWSWNAYQTTNKQLEVRLKPELVCSVQAAAPHGLAVHMHPRMQAPSISAC